MKRTIHAGALIIFYFYIGSCGRPIGAQPVLTPPVLSAETTSEKSKARSFTFQYRFRVKGLKQGDAARKTVRVWMPTPSNSEFQQVKRLRAQAPAEIQENKESKYGNRILFIEAEAPANGEFTVDIPFEVTRYEVLRGPQRPAQPSEEKLSGVQRDLYLEANRMVPTTGKPLKLLTPIDLHNDKLSLARQLYDVVDEHVVYKKDGTGWGRGDSNWVCDSGYGNCSDFHSLFMSLARSQGLPTRFEIGFSIPNDKSGGPVLGYHCWAWFYHDERGWIPVDISEADKHPDMKEYYFGNLTADRVVFSVGRDLVLVPHAEQEPINFFIYPHIEINGQVLPAENLELQFAYKNRL